MANIASVKRGVKYKKSVDAFCRCIAKATYTLRWYILECP